MFKFLYDFLFYDPKTNKVSHTKFWSNVGYGLMCFNFVYSVVHPTELDATIWMLFGAIVIGNRSLLKILKITKDNKNEQV